MVMIIMSYVETLSPHKKRYELTEDIKGIDDEFTKYLQCNSGGFKKH